LFEFPQGVFIVSLAQAVLPTMSRQAVVDDQPGFRESLRFALVLILLVTIPAALGLILCSQAVYSLFFMRGNFSAFDVSQAALALTWYAPGLLFVGISRVVVPSFYAMKDTRTPVLVSFWTLLVNVTAGLLLMRIMGHAGLALALTISSIFNAIVLMLLLARRLGDLGLALIWRTFVCMLPGLTAMGFIVILIINQVDWLTPGSFGVRFVLLGVAVVAGGLVYFASLWLFGINEMRQAWAIVLNRFSRPLRKG
jgi:putative peptidoglycan lipid II flippase